MKLLNKSLVHLSVWLFLIIGLWSAVFYFNMLNEIKESIDEGLDNYKRQIIYQADKTPSLLKKNNFKDGFYSIEQIPAAEGLAVKDYYADTMMYMQDADDESPELEPVRMLSTAFQHKDQYYKLQIINSMVEEDDLVEELLRDALGLYVLLIGTIIIINNLVLRRLWQPFYSLLHQLKSYRIGSGRQFVQSDTRTREFTDLQQAINTLLQHTTRTYEQQKQFIGNAAHELQTPLAIIMNKLELLAENGALQDSQADTVSEVMGIIERLARLNKSLLLLTKIENRQFFDNKPVALNQVVKQCIEDLEDIASYRKVSISLSEEADMYVEMDPSLAAVALANLMRNAIFHNRADGLINVVITAQTIEISNTGTDHALNPDQIFTRFYRTGDHDSGTGLGLAIIKAICDIYGFSVSYNFKQERHCFQIQFKP